MDSSAGILWPSAWRGGARKKLPLLGQPKRPDPPGQGASVMRIRHAIWMGGANVAYSESSLFRSTWTLSRTAAPATMPSSVNQGAR